MSSELVDAGLGLGEGGFGAGEVELDFAGMGEDRGLDVGILLVDGGGAGVDRGLRAEGHAELAPGEEEGRQCGGEAGFDLLVEEGLELLGRAGEEDDDAVLVPVGDGGGVEIWPGALPLRLRSSVAPSRMSACLVLLGGMAMRRSAKRL